MPTSVPPPPVPERLSFKALREAVQECRACDLWQGTTQAVLGARVAPTSSRARSTRARLMLVGEQPGDREDLAACRPWLDAFVADLAAVAIWLQET
jgi:uracil-DNA glycosylase